MASVSNRAFVRGTVRPSPWSMGEKSETAPTRGAKPPSDAPPATYAPDAYTSKTPGSENASAPRANLATYYGATAFTEDPIRRILAATDPKATINPQPKELTSDVETVLMYATDDGPYQGAPQRHVAALMVAGLNTALTHSKSLEEYLDVSRVAQELPDYFEPLPVLSGEDLKQAQTFIKQAQGIATEAQTMALKCPAADPRDLLTIAYFASSKSPAIRDEALKTYISKAGTMNDLNQIGTYDDSVDRNLFGSPDVRKAALEKAKSLNPTPDQLGQLFKAMDAQYTLPRQEAPVEKMLKNAGKNVEGLAQDVGAGAVAAVEIPAAIVLTPLIMGHTD